MKPCMISPKGRDEFEKLMNESDMAVTMLRSDSCPHCREVHPIVEKRCKDVKGFVPVIDCPVDKPWCVETIKSFKKDGIPLVVGTQKGKPVFMVEGSRKDEINNAFDTLVNMIQEYQQQGNKPQPKQEAIAPVSPAINTMIQSVVGFQSPSQRIPAPLCTPNVDCSPREFEERAIQFLVSKKEHRDLR